MIDVNRPHSMRLHVGTVPIIIFIFADFVKKLRSNIDNLLMSEYNKINPARR